MFATCFNRAIIGVLLLGVSCAGMSSVQSEYDEFTAVKRTDMTYNPLAGSSLLDTSQVRLQAVCATTKDSIPSYMLRVIVYGNSNGWCFIKKGASLLFVVDGERKALSGSGSLGSREVLGDNVSEVAVYPTTLDFIRLLSEAKEVRVRVVGSRRNIERHFGKANSKNFRDFVEACDGSREAEAASSRM